MNVFNLIAGAGGPSEGLYIWKKSEWITDGKIENPYIWFGKGTSTSTATQIIDSSSVDLTKYPTIERKSVPLNINVDNERMLVEYLNGFATTGNSRFYLSNGDLKYVYSSIGTETQADVLGFKPIDAKNAEVYVSTNITVKNEKYNYAGEKTLPPYIGDMVGYVVSDKEDAYPDGAGQGGFYYERFEPLDEGVFGCTKMETGVFVPTQYNGLVTVEHSLGAIPKMCLAWQEENASYCSNTWTVFNNAGSGASYAELYSNKTARQYGNAGDGATVTRCPFSAYGNSPAWFGAGLTYHYIIFA